VVDLIVDEGVPAPWRRRLRLEVTRMVRAAARTDGRDDFSLALRLTTDAVIRILNRDYRHKNKPTDVLAFPQTEPGVLGDVVISVETARRQAKQSLHRELRFLAAHGLCHLLGYDHNTDAEEAEMNARMARLLAESSRRGTIRPA
jgi:probable rRNA maturation factor